MIRRSTRFWFAYCAVLVALGAAYFLLATGAYANDPHRDPPRIPPPLVVVEHDSDNRAAIAAVAGAAVTWAVMCGIERHRHPVKVHKVCPKKK